MTTAVVVNASVTSKMPSGPLRPNAKSSATIGATSSTTSAHESAPTTTENAGALIASSRQKTARGEHSLRRRGLHEERELARERRMLRGSRRRDEIRCSLVDRRWDLD